MPVYVVVDITIHDPETYDEYRTIESEGRRPQTDKPQSQPE